MRPGGGRRLFVGVSGMSISLFALGAAKRLEDVQAFFQERVDSRRARA